MGFVTLLSGLLAGVASGTHVISPLVPNIDLLKRCLQYHKSKITRRNILRYYANVFFFRCWVALFFLFCQQSSELMGKHTLVKH